MDYYSNDESRNVKRIMETCKSLVVYDLETTGLNGKKDQIIEFSAMKFEIRERKLIERSRITIFSKPDDPLPEVITEITGYTDEFLADKSPENVSAFEIAKYFECVDAVCGYNNNSFDNSFLETLNEKYGLNISLKNTMDVLLLARQNIPKSEVENHKLITIANYFGVASDLTFHQAHDDVLATVRVLNCMLEDVMNKKEEETVKVIPNVYSISYWEGFRGYSRIYVATNKGTVYYDIRGKKWAGKDVDVNTLDMPTLIDKCLKMTNCNTEADFARYKGVVK